LVCLIAGTAAPSDACTAITLKAGDGAILLGRTMEWGSFDLNGRVIVIPRGHAFTGQTPDGRRGYAWKGKYGVVGTDMLEKELLADGLNEKGLALGLLYHPGFAGYAPYKPEKASETMGPTDVAQYLLTTCATVEDVRAAMKRVRVVPVVEPVLGFPAPVHFIIADASGKEIVIEFEKGETKIFDAPLGVMTNAPSYDWHITNLRNYVNLSAVALPDKKIEDLRFAPLGAGSGMIGLPGDFTPPSRFIRAVAFTATARRTADGPETMYEMFRIFDNFNLPLGAAEGSDQQKGPSLMRSSTIWTVVYDTKNKLMYYHTQHNRRVRKVDAGAIDFATLKGRILTRPLDTKKVQDFEEVNPVRGR
jgi:choloylglycine hydrolase